MSLHLQRRARAVDALAAAGIDMLVCGRQDHINYITGAHQLWTAGTRPFGPVCTLNVATAEIFLLSTWDEGVPDDIGPRPPSGHHLERSDHLPAPSRQPGDDHRPKRWGVDAWSPGMAGLLSAVAPEAEIVPVDDILLGARRTKLPSEVDAIRAACAVAAAGAEAATVHPGSDAQRLAAGVEAMALAGSSTPRRRAPSPRAHRRLQLHPVPLRRRCGPHRRWHTPRCPPPRRPHRRLRARCHRPRPAPSRPRRRLAHSRFGHGLRTPGDQRPLRRRRDP